MDPHVLKAILVGFILSNPLFASESHDKEHPEHSEKEERGEHQEDEAGEDGHDHGHKDEKKDAHGHEESGHEEGSSKFGPGKAILAVEDGGLRFRLSPESLSFLKIKFENIQSELTPSKGRTSKQAETLLKLPRSAIAYFQSETSVYRLSNDWIEEIPIQIVRKEKDFIWVRSKKLLAEDRVATTGVHFLRTAQLEASGQGGEGHAH